MVAQQKGEIEGEQAESTVFKAYASFVNPDAEVTFLETLPEKARVGLPVSGISSCRAVVVLWFFGLPTRAW